jgi:molybdopterin molybdotransferase
MIPFEKAYDIVMDSVRETGGETVPFQESLNRILNEHVTSDVDMPPFDRSSVDGFACRNEDLKYDLEVIETIPAGVMPTRKLKEKCCSRIMTGAAVPEGADCIIMVEDTVTLRSGKIRFKGKSPKSNISFRAEDVRKGDIVLNAGRIINPQDIAVLAAVGHTSVRVSKMPRVGVISSGSELVEPADIPSFSQIRNSNSWQLLAQIRRAGAQGKYFGIAKDDPDVTYSILIKALSDCDIVLITGGVSMGDFDFIPSVLEKAGINILFSRVAVQPGKPTTFGIHGNAVVFGLPGNPVSSYIQFELLVRPLIAKMMRYNWHPYSRQLPMKTDYSRRSTDRMALVLVKLSADDEVSPVEYHGSAHISALPDSDGIIAVPVGVKTIRKGELVSVRQI